MYFLLFLAFAILGVLLFLSLVLFYHNKRKVKKRRKPRYVPDYGTRYIYDDDYYEDYYNEEPWHREDPSSRARYQNNPRTPAIKRGEILRHDVGASPVGNGRPDVRTRMDGSARPDVNNSPDIDTRQAPQFPQDEPVRGDAYIPVVHVKKKIPGLSKQELIHFIGSGALYTIDTLAEPGGIDLRKHTLTPEIKGQVVLTKKKDVLKIFNRSSEFKYILSVIVQK
jgi:hypothetical protein